jgi:rSAM/selenodomain-associated transferase 2
VSVSVVIPTWNEERRVGACLEAITSQPGIAQVIVADGGSTDATVPIARRVGGVEVVTAPRGRGTQLNAGAARARGDVLLFLHADAALPPDATTHIAGALADPAAVAGAFRTRHVVSARARRLVAAVARVADLRSRVARLPYGDQALFVRRTAYAAAGGFPDTPLCEDLELARRLRRLGAIRIVGATVTVSARRLEASPLFAALCWNTFPTLYRLGMSPATLARLYGDPR